MNLSATHLSLGIVVIGKNEARNLKRCLTSTLSQKAPVIFVDAHSKDDSLLITRKFTAVESFSVPFGQRPFAGVARNFGAQILLAEHRAPFDLIQFVDGDTELIPTWLSFAKDQFQHDPELVLLTGSVLEKEGEKGLTKKLLSMEWRSYLNRRGCGGNFMIRASWFEKVRGFDERLLAAEDTEFCFRLRRQGAKLRFAEEPMTLHHGESDLSVPFFRAIRAGYAFQQISWLYHLDRRGLFHKENRSQWFYGGLSPCALCMAVTLGFKALALLTAFFIYGGLFIRVFVTLRSTQGHRLALLGAFHGVLSKFLGSVGALLYWLSMFDQLDVTQRSSPGVKYSKAEIQSQSPQNPT